MLKTKFQNILLLILVFVVMFFVLEIMLRFNSGIFGYEIKNQILTKYYPGKDEFILMIIRPV